MIHVDSKVGEKVSKDVLYSECYCDTSNSKTCYKGRNVDTKIREDEKKPNGVERHLTEEPDEPECALGALSPIHEFFIGFY